MPEKTKRIIDITSKVEARQAPDGKRYIEGVIPYESRSEILWDFVEVIAPGAFNKTLADGADVKAFWAHDDTDILGTRSNGTLKLTDAADGLHFSIEMRDTEVAKDHFETVARGDCSGVSFAFEAVRQEWDESQAPAVRTLREVKLLEISPGVAFPAYSGAYSSAAIRSLIDEARVNPHAAFSARNKPKTDPAPDPSPAPALAPSMTPEERARAELDLVEARYRL